MRPLLSLIFFVQLILANAQHDFKDQFDLFSFENKKLGKVEFCTFHSTANHKKPLLIFIHGSGNEPTFAYHQDLKTYFWKAFTELQNYKDQYHVVFVSKPGVPLFDTIQKDPVNYSTSYPVSDEYRNRFSMEWRAESASEIINQACKMLPVDKTKIVVIGHSQGGQVAPKVAVINKKVTHVVMLNTNALNHIYDFVLQERFAAFSGEQSFELAQQNIDSLFTEYRSFFSDPLNKSKTWNGDTYYRWASFSDETPLENMLKLKIPIYMVCGGKDYWGSTIMNSDYAAIEFLRHRKSNLVYSVYPNANHFLQDEIIENEQTKFVDMKPVVFSDIHKWVMAE
jgi:pimeloyl-ACP methyl ester carboxylesterase